jgi:hypothetical protein
MQFAADLLAPEGGVILIVVTYGIGARRCGLLLAPWHCQLLIVGRDIS